MIFSWFSRQRRSSNDRKWVIYYLSEHPGTQLLMEVFTSLLPVDSFELLSEVDNREDRDRAFIYIGHGDNLGPFASDGFGSGIRRRLVEPSRVESWQERPQIWWCCFSARWLENLARRDWLGFNGSIGYDSRGRQRKWWKNRFKLAFKALFDVLSGQLEPQGLSLVFESIYEDAKNKYREERSLSYPSLLLAKLLSENVRIGKDLRG